MLRKEDTETQRIQTAFALDGIHLNNEFINLFINIEDY